MDGAEIQRLDELEIEIGEVRNRLEPGRGRRAAEARSLRQDDVKALRETLHSRMKMRRPAAAMQHQHHGPGTRALHRHGRAAEGDRRKGRFHASAALPFTSFQRVGNRGYPLNASSCTRGAWQWQD